jgi:ribosomal subunit interface protein
MKTNLKVTDMKLAPETAEYLEKRLQSIEKFISGDPSSVLFDVEVGRTTEHHRTGDVFRAEINLHVGGRYYRSVSEKGDLHAAIDDARDQLVEELRSNKKKQQTVARRGAVLLKEMLQGLPGRGKNLLRGVWRKREK